ncbi:MAG: Crp/Fnr family transcriptional regulator [Vulcanimicrobiota bacterium]
MIDHPFTRSFTEAEHKQFEAICKRVEFLPGTYLLREDQPCDRFYLLERGLVSIELQRPGREVLRLQTETGGSEVGWSWLFAPYRATFDVRTVELCEAYAVEAAAMRKLMEDEPAFGFKAMQALLHTMVERLMQARLQLLDIHSVGETP